MSYSKIVIYAPGLRGMYASPVRDRCILIQNRYNKDYYENDSNHTGWDITMAPFPAPLINLIQKKT